MPITAYALALVAAFLSAAATILIRQGLRSGAAYTGFWINLAVGTIGLWAGVLLTGGPGHVSVLGVALFVLAGLVGTAGGRLLRFVSIERVGASVSAAMFNLNPLISSGLAILLLGERVTLPVIAGTVIIVA
ncbi:MAG TPA: DMT family transporter, partial [Candidatus Methylomirabilis sp.]|nr:DMT family transporter [Candidatus Methylomirabilis sp.]